jgi:4-amino-4-deoxy-L-arabinose transferase-like glycosyltransferase
LASHRIHVALLLLGSVLLLGAGLGSLDFWQPDEPRYGQVADELRSMQKGLRGLVLLHLGGEPYTQKPPLYYWLAALAGAAGGRVSEAAARLPSMLAGVGSVLLTYALGRRLFASPIAALLAGAVLLTSFRFAHQARRAQLDVMLAFFETAAMLVFWRIDARAREGHAPPRSQLFWLHAALGAAALTKGPVGWLPLAAIAVYLAWEGRLRELRGLFPAWSLGVSVAPVLLWIVAATAFGPSGFFAEAVVENLLGRLVDPESHIRPFYYYLYQLPADFLPWTLALPFAVAAALRAEPAERRAWRLLAVWVALPLVVFSLASGKRGLYLLPAFPALALACGAALDRWLRARERVPPWMRAALCLLAAAAALTAFRAAASSELTWSRFPGFEITGSLAAVLLGAAAAGLLATAAIAARPRGALHAFGPLVATVFVLELAIFTLAYPSFDAEKSPRRIASLAAALTGPDETVGIFDDAGLAGGILYYGDRQVAILPRPEHVQRFLDRGGRFVILERWKLPWLEPVGELHVHTSTRRDQRELAIVSPDPPPREQLKGE